MRSCPPEDRRFFQHDGLDLPRIVKAAYTDVRDGRKEEGASTLTMQLVRGLWLEPDKRWKRKLAEAMMTIHLEREWSKKKIFETYVNQVYLGRQADYSVHGFGEGARMFFGKKLPDISLPEAAMLAGLVQRPSYFNPFRYPQRAKERRDLVLGMMRNNHYITPQQYKTVVEEPLRVAGDSLSESRAPYFLDLVNDELQDMQSAGLHSNTAQSSSVYSTIDLNLQRAADEAVASGMQEVDKLLAKRSGKTGEKAEAALIALDPRTGEIKALVGGRDYKRSQLNRIFSKRPPGSVFKPFVYAAALDTGLSGGANIYTPASTVDDSATTFWFNGQSYEPGNFRGEHFGLLTFRQALAKSDNVAAVKVAQEVGYRAVVQMARRFGLNDAIQRNSRRCTGRISGDAARNRGRIYGVRQWRHRGETRCDLKLPERYRCRHGWQCLRIDASARSAGQLAYGEHARRGNAVWNGGVGAVARVHASRRGKNRDFS